MRKEPTDLFRSAFYLVVDARYLPIALGLGRRLNSLWDMDVHVFLEDEAAASLDVVPAPQVFVHCNRLRGLRPEGLPETHNWPAVVYDRLFAPRFLGDYDRLIYLDADIYPLCHAPELLTIPLPEGLGAVQDTASVGYSPAAVSMSRDEWLASIGLRSKRYFNSGVLLINPAIWNVIDFAAELRSYVASYAAGVQMPDQDFLNWRFQDLWTEFSPRINFQKGLFNYGYESWFNPVFLHFSSQHKPWLRPYQEDTAQGQFFPLFQEMIRSAGGDPMSLRKNKRDALPRRLRQSLRKYMSSQGITCSKERRLRGEWKTRSEHLYRGFVDDLQAGRYADIDMPPAERPQPETLFDGRYLHRPLQLTNPKAA